MSKVERQPWWIRDDEGELTIAMVEFVDGKPDDVSFCGSEWTHDFGDLQRDGYSLVERIKPPTKGQG